MTSTRMALILFAGLFFFASLVVAHDRANYGATIFIGNCGLIGRVIGVERLSAFKRINGPYQIDGNSGLWRIVKFHQSDIMVPVHGKPKVVPVNKPFEGVRYIDTSSRLAIYVFSKVSPVRASLAQVTSHKTYLEYGQRPLFNYLDHALGVYVDGFCGKKLPAKRVAMFMSSFVEPIGKDGTRVFRLERPIKAILLAPSGCIASRFELIFPARRKDTLIYVFVSGAPEHLAAILDALVKQ